MKFRVFIAPTAEANLDEIFWFIALDNPKAARRFVAGLRNAMKSLARNPRRCALAPENGSENLELRHLIYGNYRLIFHIEPAQVIIIQVRHAARRPMDERA